MWVSGRGLDVRKQYSPRWPEAKLGAFQVKRHYRQPANLELILYSTVALRAWCTDHPHALVHLNFPGIGNGRLQREDVLPIMAQLPAQVTIWEYPPAGKESAPLPTNWKPAGITRSPL